MSTAVKNIFADSGKAWAGEQFSLLWENSAIRVERILSHSYQSPAGFWYDQDEDEWVIVLRGSAALEFTGGAIVDLGEGDYIAIERHVKHRIAHTSAQTVWLALRVK
jgi:cupin 2 domain-containing protein